VCAAAGCPPVGSAPAGKVATQLRTGDVIRLERTDRDRARTANGDGAALPGAELPWSVTITPAQ
jgi:hypothetical protein